MYHSLRVSPPACRTQYARPVVEKPSSENRPRGGVVYHPINSVKVLYGVQHACRRISPLYGAFAPFGRSGSLDGAYVCPLSGAEYDHRNILWYTRGF